jgi:hypothetical protein
VQNRIRLVRVRFGSEVGSNRAGYSSVLVQSKSDPIRGSPHMSRSRIVEHRIRLVRARFGSEAGSNGAGYS